MASLMNKSGTLMNLLQLFRLLCHALGLHVVRLHAIQGSICGACLEHVTGGAGGLHEGGEAGVRAGAALR